MKEYLFEPTVASLSIVGSATGFPVRRIWCVGRNYAEHAREMGADPQTQAPCFFAKPADALVPGGGSVPYPPATADLHHEVELVAAIGRSGFMIAAENALEHVVGYGVGIDLTRRDLQLEAKRQGQPWELGKAFDNAAPVSALALAASIGHPRRGALRLSVNGVERQRGDLSDMVLPLPALIARLSQYVELAAGDILFTGTPAGVGTLVAGDAVHASIDGVGELEIVLAPPRRGGGA